MNQYIDVSTVRDAPTVYAFICGYTTIPSKGIIRGTDGLITLPVPAFVIRHPAGMMVFDTGFNRRIHTDPHGDYAPPEFYNSREHDFSSDDELSVQMRKVGLNPDDVLYVVNSHLHYDHCGGNDQFPAATVIVQEREYNAAVTAPEDKFGYRKLDFMTQQTKILLNGGYDVFGDASVVLVTTPGHTPGHQSLIVKTAQGPQMLTADACYMQKTLVDTAIPGILTNEDQFRDSLAEIRRFRDETGFIVYGHDPEFWNRIPLAPDPLMSDLSV